jgi:multidrug efflux pump
MPLRDQARTLRGDDVEEISSWATKVEAALREVPALADVNLDQAQHGLEAELIIDRPTAARFGVTVSQIDDTLYDAFGQRQVSTIYEARNQYHVVMEVAPEFWQSPEILSQIYVSTGGGPVSGTQASQPLDGTVFTKTPVKHSGNQTAPTTRIAGDTARHRANNALANRSRRSTPTGAAVSISPEIMVPLSAFAHFGAGNTPLSVNHRNLSVAVTISFNLAPNVSLSKATAAIENEVGRLGMPVSDPRRVRGYDQGLSGLARQ